ncbi:MAG: hypothetical protein HQL97_10200 [Magnetococcales bacterium]|nr:hypothetical protein [Magnetococcales bacterium]
MELIYFTIIGGALYLISERILGHIERARGEVLPYRSVIFFVIIFSLATATFSAIRFLTDAPEEPKQEQGQTRQPEAPQPTPPKAP